MTDEPLPEDQRLKDISSKAYEHPADRAATAALQSIPMLDQVVRKLIEFGYERALRQVFLAGSVRLGDDQLPTVWAVPPRRARAAGHRGAPRPLPHAVPDRQRRRDRRRQADGGRSTRARSSCSTTRELRTVLGHEAAHILSDHVLYRTALMILLSASGLARLPDARRPAAGRGQDGAARVVPRRRAVVRPRGHAGQPRPAGHLPHADGAGRRYRVAQAGPRRVRAPGDRVRGVGARLGQALAPADRARPDARVPGQARARGDALGAQRRVRPDRGRRVPQAAATPSTRGARPATPSTSTPSASARSSATRAPAWRRPARRSPDAAEKVSDWLRASSRSSWR